MLAKGVDEDRYDNWNKEREDYSKTYADNQGYGGPNHAYGMQDLNYYGDFFYANGYGYVWQPFGFAGSMMGWNPYMNGAWMFYPGSGYAFASSYPWGWLPFHDGSWTYLNNAGWAWVPGRYNGQWPTNNYLATPFVRKAPAGWTPPVPPAATTAVSSPPTVIVGSGGAKPLAIPGGRVPPNFGSLVPGRNVTVPATAHGFARPAATTVGNHAVFASPNATNHGTTGHVFAPPMVRGGVAEEPLAMLVRPQLDTRQRCLLELRAAVQPLRAPALDTNSLHVVVHKAANLAAIFMPLATVNHARVTIDFH